MKRWLAILAFVLTLFFANQAHAQSSIVFDQGYPAQGSCAGAIEVAGTITLDSCWSISGCTATVDVWQDGKIVSSYSTTVSCNVFFELITGLESCAVYNVTVEVVVTNGCTTETIRTPVTAVTTS